MGTLVQFRDLPGGPVKIKFADDITRHCLCKSCNMLSLTMYADPASHFFCETCINVQSYMHKKYDIYCPEERKNVSFDELYEARDVITVLRDQYVECPNQQNCTLKLPLEQLENHYIECMQLRSIKCNKCGTEVPASSWNKHKAECKLTYDTEFPSQESDSRHNRPEHPPASPTKPPGSASRKTGAAKRTTGAAESLYPAGQLRHMRNGDHGQGPARTGTASLPPYLSDKPKNPSSSESEKFACQYCGRKVKEENMQRHLEKCYDLPIDCPFCHQPISRKDANAHVQNCQQDIEERSKESKKNEAAKTIRDQPQPRSYPDAQAAYQGSKNISPAETRGTTSGKSSRAVREPRLTSGCYTDGKAWLPYATSGNWYAACVVIEEQFRGTEADQEARCAHFVPKLVNLKLDHIVRDLLDDPYEPQPFDCLITALIARCCLPQKVWPQGLLITWDHILMYVPSVLQERLTDGARSYLRKHVVYLDNHGPPGIEDIDVETAGAITPGDLPSVMSPVPAIREAQARSVKENDILGATQAKSRDVNTILADMQGEKAPVRKAAKKKSVAESLEDVTSKLSDLTVSETSTETESFRESEHLKSRGKPQEKLHAKGTSQSKPGEAVKSLGGLGNNAASLQQETSATLSKLPSCSRSETSAPEPSAPSRFNDISIAEPLPNTEESHDSEYLRSQGPPQQKLDVEITSEIQPAKGMRSFDGFGDSKAPSQHENSRGALSIPPFGDQSKLSAPEPPAPSKLNDLSVSETSSNMEELREDEYFRSQGQPQLKLRAESTSENQPGEGAMLLNGLGNNAGSSKPETSTALSKLPSWSRSEQSAPEPPAPSKLDHLNITEASSNTEGLREGEYLRSQGQPQQKLHVEITSEIQPAKGTRSFDGFGDNKALSQRENSRGVLSMEPSEYQSKLSAPEPPAPSKLDDLSVTEASSNMEELREDENFRPQGQPQLKLRAESTSENQPGEGVMLLNGLGNNAGSSKPETSTALSKLRSWSRSEQSAPEPPATSKLDRLNITEASSNTEGLREGEYVRSQGQPQQKLHAESTYESRAGKAARLFDGRGNSTDSSQLENSSALSKLRWWYQSEPSAPSKLDDLRVNEALSTAEALRDGAYVKSQDQLQQKPHADSLYESLLREAARLLDELDNNTASSQRETGTALSESYSWKRSEPSAPEPTAPTKIDALKTTEALSNMDELRDGEDLRPKDEQQPLLDDNTSENQSKKADSFGRGLNNTVLLQRKIRASLDKTSSLCQSEPFATETMEIIGKSITVSEHPSDAEQPCQKTYPEAPKQPGMTPTKAEVCKIQIDTKRVTCSVRGGSYEAHKSALNRTPETFRKEEPVCSAAPEERKMGSNIITEKVDRSPFSREKGKALLDRNAKENDATAKYSRAGGTSVQTIPYKHDSHLERTCPEHRTQAAESRSIRSERSQGTSSHEGRVFWNSSRKSQRNSSGTAQQRRAVTEQGKYRCASNSTTISRAVIESAVQRYEIPCDTSNAGTEHSSPVSRKRAPDQNVSNSSLISSTRREERYVLEEGHKDSISAELKRQRDPGLEKAAEGTDEDAPTWEAREVELASRRVRRQSEEATASASEPGFANRQGYSADNSAFGASYVATSYRPNNVVVAGSGFQIDIACSQEIPPGRPSRAFSRPADIARQDTPDLPVEAAYRSAKYCDRNREQPKEHYGRVQNSWESSLNDTTFVMETEV